MLWFYITVFCLLFHGILDTRRVACLFGVGRLSVEGLCLGCRWLFALGVENYGLGFIGSWFRRPQGLVESDRVPSVLATWIEVHSLCLCVCVSVCVHVPVCVFVQTWPSFWSG